MVDVLGLIQSAVAPFLENKVIVYLIVLLILGVDTFSAYQFSTNPDTISPIKELEAGQYFLIPNWTDIYGQKMCNRTDGSFFFLEGILFHRASNDEINLYCRETNVQCKVDNITSVGQAFGCSLTDPNQQVQHGVFGDMLTAPLQLMGNASNIEFLKTIQIWSWELFALMIMIPLFLWGVTASSRS